MAAGFFISKSVGIVAIVLGLGAVATIIALSVVYAQEKNKPPTTTTTTPTPTNTTTPDSSLPWNQWRLPKMLMPEFYEVSLQPFLTPNEDGMYIFKGNSSVIFVCLEPTNLILIHSNKLNYTTPGTHWAVLEGVDGASAPGIISTELVTLTQYLVVKLDGQLQKDQRYRLSTNFTGELADDLAGFYRNDTRQINGTEWSITEFQTTPKMSTYLLAFIVSQFDYKENTTENVTIRIWGRPKAIQEDQGEYALRVTGDILKFFEGYYSTTYPLPKSDQVGLPDFNAGAMENWGLVTYRENSLLLDNSSSISNKERVVTVIAHELAHQWFGNLVTLKWWNDLWLNEGFASYVEYLGANYVESDWNIKDLMVLNEVYTVMATDALASSHPLSFREEEINTPAQISEVFDTIAYSKGASVLRMLSDFLTEEVFKEGLQSYLHNFSYGNTVYTDLWNHLQGAVTNKNVSLPTGRSISDIMDTWTLQMGFPVVTVDTSTGTITQKHFLLDPNSVVDRPSTFNYTWIVPITWMTNLMNLTTVTPVERYWLTSVSDTNNAFKMNDSNWLLLNLNVSGYFRVNYNQENWDRLLTQLSTDRQVIPVINRAQIIDDAFNLARATHLNVTVALNTTRFLSQETEYMPWQAALNNLQYFQLMFDRSEVFGVMTKYVQRQVTPLFNHFKNFTNNWTNITGTLTEQYNQINAISTACSYGIAECQQLAISYFKEWNSTNSNPVPPNLRSAIYCSMVATGGEEAWDFIWKKFQEATVVSEADKLRTALTCSTEPWILNRYLQYTIDPTKIRKQDATSTINSIASNVVGQSLAWDFVRGNWKMLFTQYGGGSFSFSRLILAVTQRFSTEFELQQLEQFKAENQDVGFGSGTRALEQALEKTRNNINWVKQNRDVVLAWFRWAAEEAAA
ncbi:AMPN Aminopeptidase, partial [Thinocorus orbignyianus]|nr:AMPN Aminopeptidase [Thinocorus orbignyianus]